MGEHYYIWPNVLGIFKKYKYYLLKSDKKMELSYIFYKELPIDENNIFERNISDKIEVQNALFKKSNKYTITGLSINQDTDSLIEVTDKNRKQILQKLIENLLKEKKNVEDVYSLQRHDSEGYEKVIPLKKKTATELPPLKLEYYSQHTKKLEEINFYDY